MSRINRRLSFTVGLAACMVFAGSARAAGAESKIDTFSDALMTEAKQGGWTVISMKNDWKRIFAFER